MNEPIIHLSVITPDPVDERHARNNADYIEWITRTDRELTESQRRFIPLKPKMNQSNLYNL